MKQHRSTRARAVQTDGFAMEGGTTMHILMTEAQAKVIGGLRFDGNLVIEQDGESITLTYAKDGNLLFQRVAPDGDIENG